jgi:hypothetical protein
MEKEEEEALIVKVFESLVGDEPFHSSNVSLLEEDEETIGGEEEGETDSMFGSDHIK